MCFKRSKQTTQKDKQPRLSDLTTPVPLAGCGRVLPTQSFHQEELSFFGSDILVCFYAGLIPWRRRGENANCYLPGAGKVTSLTVARPSQALTEEEGWSGRQSTKGSSTSVCNTCKWSYRGANEKKGVSESLLHDWTDSWPCEGANKRKVQESPKRT